MAIVDVDVARQHGWSPADLTGAYLDGGASLLQLRAKHASSGEMLDLAAAITEIAHRAGALVIVNDRADIAGLCGADGVHLGQDDLPPEKARRLLSAEAIVGLSTHTDAQLEAAFSAPVSYVAVGPVFATRTKATGYEALGLETVRRRAARARAHALPLVAIGGVTLDTAAEIIGAGASSVAVIGDLLTGGDPAARVREYLQRVTV